VEPESSTVAGHRETREQTRERKSESEPESERHDVGLAEIRQFSLSKQQINAVKTGTPPSPSYRSLNTEQASISQRLFSAHVFNIGETKWLIQVVLDRFIDCSSGL
jgi:hypothetical protein